MEKKQKKRNKWIYVNYTKFYFKNNYVLFLQKYTSSPVSILFTNSFDGEWMLQISLLLVGPHSIFILFYFLFFIVFLQLVLEFICFFLCTMQTFIFCFLLVSLFLMGRYSSCSFHFHGHAIYVLFLLSWTKIIFNGTIGHFRTTEQI